MTYANQDNSVHDGAPVEFFLFTGPFKTYRYNDSDQDLTLGGQVYESLAISRGKIDVSSSLVSPSTVDIELPFDCDLANDYAYLSTPEYLDVEVYRAHLGSDLDTDYRVIWTARVLVFSVSGLMVQLQTQNLLNIDLASSAVTVYYQVPCNHRLYDDRCKVNRATHTTTSDVTVVGPSAITVIDDGVADGDLVAGEATNTRTGERRLILDNLVNVVTLAQGFTDILVGDTVTLTKGCIHTIEECKTKFANQDNYGGFRFIPSKVPVE